MKLKIQIPKEQFYQRILLLLQPLTKLTEKETVFFALILEKYHKLSDVPADYREELLFSEKSRKEMREHLKYTVSDFNFLLSQLKTKKMLLKTEKGLKISKVALLVTPDAKNLIYEFDIK
jgi:hypothetical protein